jgi:predicted metal-dependent peptidase
MFKPCDTDYNLDRHIIKFLQDNTFFAEMSRYIRKAPTSDIPTAAVAYDPEFDDVTLYWNPDFLASMSDAEVRGLLTHEFYHLVFDHLTTRRRSPPRLWNVATDLAINSIITDHSTGNNNIALPAGGLVPGVFPMPPSAGALRTPTAEEKAAAPIANLIASFPKNQASEWYFERLKEKVEEEKKKRGDGVPQPGAGDPDDLGGLDSMDDHSTWDQIPEDLKELIKGKVKAIVERATKAADSQANGWGNIPAELREQIRTSVTPTVNWRNVLRQFVGSLARGERATTVKRINKRFPYIHPGTKRGYVAKLLVAIDQSGSVDDTQLTIFFSELAALTKKVSVTILPFDCSADLKDSFEWKKGSKVEAKRVRGGGTDFNAPTLILNDPKNRGRWDGMLILTDGECSKPIGSRLKRGWVLSPGHKLLFATDETTIHIDSKPSNNGAWR